MRKPIKGKIVDWVVVRGMSGHCVVEGKILHHADHGDGTYIMTSQIEIITGGMVETLNSRYYLGSMKGEVK